MESSFGPTRTLKTAATNQSEVDPAFAEWLHQRLAAERAAVVLQLQRHLAHELSEHHAVLLKDLEATSRLPPIKAAAGAEPPEVRSAWRDRNVEVQTLACSTASNLPSRPSAETMKGSKESTINQKVSAASRSSGESKATSNTLTGKVQGHKEAVVAALNTFSDASHRTPQLHHEELHGMGKLAHNWVFESVTSILIMLNTIFMAAEVQFVGSQIGHDLGHQDYAVSPTQSLPGAVTAFDTIFVVFLVLFLLEFLVRAADLRCSVFATGWMWFDAFILTMSCMDCIGRFSNTSSFDINPSAMRMARLCRMLRVLKFLKAKEGFAALFLLVKSIQASTHALVWSCLLLVFVMLIAGLLINQLLLNFLEDESIPSEERIEVFDLFGTWTRMFITMFEFTLGNWAPPQRVLMRNVAEWWGLFVVLYRAVLCFALVNISAAVFNSETSKAAQADDDVVMMNKERASRHHGRKLEALFKALDKTGDGRITWDEFHELVNDSVMKRFLSTLQVDVEDVQELFKLLDDGDGTVFHEEFVRGMKALGGEAKSLNIIMLTKMARTMDGKLDKLMSAA